MAVYNETVSASLVFSAVPTDWRRNYTTAMSLWSGSSRLVADTQIIEAIWEMTAVLGSEVVTFGSFSRRGQKVASGVKLS